MFTNYEILSEEMLIGIKKYGTYFIASFDTNAKVDGRIVLNLFSNLSNWRNIRMNGSIS